MLIVGMNEPKIIDAEFRVVREASAAPPKPKTYGEMVDADWADLNLWGKIGTLILTAIFMAPVVWFARAFANFLVPGGTP